MCSVEESEAIEFSAGATKFARQHIREAQRILFRFVKKQDGIDLGVLSIFDQSGSLYDLNASMIEEKLLVENEQFFYKGNVFSGFSCTSICDSIL